jgi:hypothetical protein
MFHTMSNASKAAYGQTLVHAQKRGFKLVDTNGVATHQVNYGEEWVPRWRFRELIAESMKDRPSLTDDRPCPELPWEVKAMLPALRVTRKVTARLPWFKEKPTAAPAAQGESAPGEAAGASVPTATAQQSPSETSADIAVPTAQPTPDDRSSANASAAKKGTADQSSTPAASTATASTAHPAPTKPQPPASRTGGGGPDPIRVVA